MIGSTGALCAAYRPFERVDAEVWYGVYGADGGSAGATWHTCRASSGEVRLFGEGWSIGAFYIIEICAVGSSTVSRAPGVVANGTSGIFRLAFK
jgi:hypothetical protein